MRVEMIVQSTDLPPNGVSLITAELEKRLWSSFPDAKVRVREGSHNHLEIYAKKEQTTLAHEIVEQAFNEAEDWLITS
ncbi:DinI-like family protein [Vibrio mediterranei]|uniref:DinI-like family protein n=1 Tax=Vibrio mediterranei TaxID=689 RepID=UPI00148C75F5|nr:DinI-like family protein [Vibrio mediterranei]NOI26658.1 DinI family protein [Vibrio mediterranei]